MKNRSAFISLIALQFFTLCGLKAQTVNQGDLIIMPETLVSSHFDLLNDTSGDFINDGELHIYKNFQNEGLFTFTPGENGYVIFQGTATQQLSGAMPSEFFDVAFNNPSPQPAFALSGDISIFGNADFLDGIVDNATGGGTITFMPQSSHSNTDDASYVSADVFKEGNEAFTYPVGDGGFYRYAAISAPSAVTDVFSGQYLLEDSDPLYPHTSIQQSTIDFIDNTEYWVIERSSGSSDVMLTLTWSTSTTPSLLTNNPDAIRIVRWDAAAGAWTDQGGVVDVATNSVTTPVTVDGYGVFTLAKTKTEETALVVVVYNAVSPDGEGKYDFFFIENINLYPNNRVTVYNRWGVKLFDTRNYDSTGNVFNGYSDGRATISREGKLQTGTYFYTLEYEYSGDGNPRTVKKSGYLYLDND